MDSVFDENDSQVICIVSLSEIDGARHHSHYPAVPSQSWVLLLLDFITNRYTTSAMVLQEESGMVTRDTSNRTPIIQSIKSKIVAGDWDGSESVLKEQCNDK